MSLRRDGTARRRAPPQDLVDRLLARERSAPRAHRGRAAPAGSAEGKAEEGTARPGRRPGRGDDLRRAGQGRRLHGGGPPRHHTERSKWRHTFRRLAADALAALTASDPVPAQRAVAKIVDLACDMKRYDYFHSDDPVEAAKFVVPEAVAALWESVLRHGGFAALAGRAPEQLIRWEADYGWTRRGYGQVAEKEVPLAVPLARLLATPDMWRTFAESYLEALEVAGRADPKRPRTVYGTFDEISYRRKERADDLAAWHEMLLDRFAGTPEDELLDRLAASPALAGPELNFLRARIAERRGDISQAATLITKCLKKMPGHQAYLDFAVKVGAELPARAGEIAAERARAAEYLRAT